MLNAKEFLEHPLAKLGGNPRTGICHGNLQEAFILSRGVLPQCHLDRYQAAARSIRERVGEEVTEDDAKAHGIAMHDGALAIPLELQHNARVLVARAHGTRAVSDHPPEINHLPIQPELSRFNSRQV